MRQSAVKVVGELPVLTGPLVVEMMFYLSRPKSHYGTGRNHRKVKPSAPRYHTKKPDLTKIIRSTEDALTGIVWRDDSQIVARDSGKLYADHQPPGVRIVIRSVEQQGG